MNRDLFGFKAEPFSVYPDNKYFFSSMSHDKAISLLEYGINSRKGFMLLTGLKGSGKTTTCNVLKESLVNCNVAVINSNLKEPNKMIKDICSAFGRECNVQDSQSFFGLLMDFFVSEYKEGRNNLIIIDDAENISDDSLELLNSFMEIEIEKCKLVQVILCGSPDMHDRLKNVSSRLGPKFTFTVELVALTMKDTADYVEYRLQKAMGKDFPLFRKPSYIEIYHYSKGIPSEINRVAQKAIEIANEKKSSRVAPNHVKMAAASLYGASRRRSLALLPVGAVAVLALVFSFFYFQIDNDKLKQPPVKEKKNTVVADNDKTQTEPAVISKPVAEMKTDEKKVVEKITVNQSDKKVEKPAVKPVEKPAENNPEPVAQVKEKYGCVATTSGLKIRKKPNVNSSSVGNVPYKGRVLLKGMTEDHEWWEASYKGKSGYMFAKYIKYTEAGECR